MVFSNPTVVFLTSLECSRCEGLRIGEASPFQIALLGELDRGDDPLSIKTNPNQALTLLNAEHIQPSANTIACAKGHSPVMAHVSCGTQRTVGEAIDDNVLIEQCHGTRPSADFVREGNRVSERCENSPTGFGERAPADHQRKIN